MTRARVEQLQKVLANSSRSGDRRPQRSIDFCKSVEDVLTSANLGRALAAAQLQARKPIEASVAQPAAEEEKEDGEEAEEAEVGRVSPRVSMQPRLSRMSTVARAIELRDLDEATSDVEVRAIVEGLFEVLDSDGDGVLEGQEAERAISDLVQHVLREGAERAEMYGGRRMVPSEDAVRRWVWETVDKDGDGKITLAEAIAGFMAVVNDIDKREERGPV